MRSVGVEGQQCWYQRFFKLPEGVKIIFEDGTNSRGGNRTFEPYHERIIRMSKQYKDNMRQETVNLPDGVKVHYYFDGEEKISLRIMGAENG